MIEGRRAILKRILMAGGAVGVGAASTKLGGAPPVGLGEIQPIAAVNTPIDATDVIYTAIGGLPRTQDEKNEEFVSVTDFGKDIGNGMTDATAALKKAFGRGGDIYVPAGNYLIKEPGPIPAASRSTSGSPSGSAAILTPALLPTGSTMTWCASRFLPAAST